MKQLAILLFLFSSFFGFSQNQKVYNFIENNGQWNENVKYKAEINGGYLYLEQNQLTYNFFDENGLQEYFHAHNQREPKTGLNKLIREGYGVENDKEEEIIDRWFRELCANVVVDGDFGGPLEGMATGNVDIETIKRDNK